jgi:Mg2+-importing ATPase
LGLAPPPELAARFAHASAANPDSTYAAALFQTGWFVESLLTQTLIIHVIRTNKVPFVQSRVSWQLIMTSGAIMLVGMWLPSSPIGQWLGLVPLPSQYWPFLLITLLLYVALTQAVKVWLVRRNWI